MREGSYIRNATHLKDLIDLTCKYTSCSQDLTLKTAEFDYGSFRKVCMSDVVTDRPTDELTDRLTIKSTNLQSNGVISRLADRRVHRESTLPIIRT